jgi:K+/H+ antiporter YhaU regulatory subunit KhtT
MTTELTLDSASRAESKETGWKSKDSIEELKEKFHRLTHKAKQEAHAGDLEESLKLYKKAYKIQNSKIVAQRIAKLEVWKCCFL